MMCHPSSHFSFLLNSLPLMVSSAGNWYSLSPFILQCCCKASLFHCSCTAWHNVMRSAFFHGSSLVSTCALGMIPRGFTGVPDASVLTDCVNNSPTIRSNLHL